MSRLYNDLDQGITPISVFFPNLPIPSHFKRDAARKEMVKLFSKASLPRPPLVDDRPSLLTILVCDTTHTPTHPPTHRSSPPAAPRARRARTARTSSRCGHGVKRAFPPLSPSFQSPNQPNQIKSNQSVHPSGVCCGKHLNSPPPPNPKPGVNVSHTHAHPKQNPDQVFMDIESTSLSLSHTPAHPKQTPDQVFMDLSLSHTHKPQTRYSWTSSTRTGPASRTTR